MIVSLCARFSHIYCVHALVFGLSSSLLPFYFLMRMNFSDSDGNGYISKIETMACVRMFVKLTDSSYQSQPAGERFQSIIEAFFRVFDSNGNGIIEIFEVNEILSDLVSGVAAIVCSVVDHFEPYLLNVRSFALKNSSEVPSEQTFKLKNLSLVFLHPLAGAARRCGAYLRREAEGDNRRGTLLHRQDY